MRQRDQGSDKASKTDGRWQKIMSFSDQTAGRHAGGTSCVFLDVEFDTFKRRTPNRQLNFWVRSSEEGSGL